jgi:hypothetical protein
MIMAGYPTKELQDEFINTIRKSQETVVEAVRTWADMIQSVTPKVPSVQVPLADKLPKPEEVVASAYDFAEKLLASQREFAEELLRATIPLMPSTGDSKPQKKAAAV